MGNEATFDDAETMGGMPSRSAAVPHEVRFDTTPRDPPAQYTSSDDLEYLFEHSRDLMCVASLEGFFLKINPAFKKTLGWTELQIRSKPFMDFVHPDDREETIGAMEVLRHGNPVRTFENRYLCASGDYRAINWNAYPRKDGTLTAVGRDVTAERRPPQEDISTTIEVGLRNYFASGDSRDAFIEATGTAEKGVTWLKWGIAFVVAIFGAGVAYSQWIADNAEMSDLKKHVQEDLVPVKEDVSSIKTSVDKLVVVEAKRAEREGKAEVLDKEVRLLEAYQADYQERLTEYSATKSAGRRASRPGKSPEHIALEADLGFPIKRD